MQQIIYPIIFSILVLLSCDSMNETGEAIRKSNRYMEGLKLTESQMPMYFNLDTLIEQERGSFGDVYYCRVVHGNYWPIWETNTGRLYYFDENEAGTSFNCEGNKIGGLFLSSDSSLYVWVHLSPFLSKDDLDQKRGDTEYVDEMNASGLRPMIHITYELPVEHFKEYSSTM